MLVTKVRIAQYSERRLLLLRKIKNKVRVFSLCLILRNCLNSKYHNFKSFRNQTYDVVKNILVGLNLTTRAEHPLL